MFLDITLLFDLTLIFMQLCYFNLVIRDGILLFVTLLFDMIFVFYVIVCFYTILFFDVTFIYIYVFYKYVHFYERKIAFFIIKGCVVSGKMFQTD